MTGGGAGSLAYLHEDAGFLESPNDSTYKLPGKDATVDTVEFSRNTEQLYDFGIEPTDTIVGNFEGSISLSFVLTGDVFWHNHVFGGAPSAGGESSAPYTYTWTPEAGRLQSARFYVGLDFLNGTVERELQGVIFTQLQIDVAQGDPVQITLNGIYGKEPQNPSLTPGTLPDTTGEPLVFHGATLSIPNSTALAKMQSATLTVENGARFQRDFEEYPVDAVMGGVSTTLDIQKVVTSTDLLDTAASDTVADGQSSTLAMSGDGTNALRYDLGGVVPESYGWDGIGEPDADVLESLPYTVESTSVTADSAAAEAR